MKKASISLFVLCAIAAGAAAQDIPSLLDQYASPIVVFLESKPYEGDARKYA